MGELLACIARALGLALIGGTLNAVLAAITLGIGVLITIASGGVLLITFAAAVAFVLGWGLAVFAVIAATAIIACFFTQPAQPQAGNPPQGNQGLTGKPAVTVNCPVCDELRPWVIATLIVAGIKFLP